MEKNTPYSKSSFKIAYGGPAVDDGTMDAYEFSSTVMALAFVCQRSAKHINGEDSKLDVRVDANFQKGSFVFEIQLIHSFLGLFDGEGIKNAAEIVRFLGEAFLLYRVLAGKSEDEISTEATSQEGMVVVNAGNHSPVTINQQVVMVCNDPEIKMRVKRVVAPLIEDDVESVTILDENGKQLVEVPNELASSFANSPDLSLPGQEHQEEKPMVFVNDRLLGIAQVNLEGPGSWKLSAGESPFSVKVEDERFLEKVNSGLIRFGSGDIVKVRIRTETRILNGIPKEKHFVERVLMHSPKMSQATLPHSDKLD